MNKFAFLDDGDNLPARAKEGDALPTKGRSKGKRNEQAAALTPALDPKRRDNNPPEPLQPEEVSLPRKGRPAGRRSDPDYEQVTAYIPKQVHQDIKLNLLIEQKTFSGLIEELLVEYLSTQKSKNAKT
jgi:hypothetical protein